MTTFDDDYIQFEHDGKVSQVALKTLGLEWPPPERVMTADGILFERVSFSSITDEQRSKMTHVARGGLFVSIPPAVEG